MLVFNRCVRVCATVDVLVPSPDSTACLVMGPGISQNFLVLSLMENVVNI